MLTTEYWNEAATMALEEANLSASAEQLKIISENLAIAAQQQSMAFGDFDAPRDNELEKVKHELKIEKEKRVCFQCCGHGVIVSNDGVRTSHSSCFKCKGVGRC